MRAVLVKDGVVHNVIIVGDGYDAPEGFQLVPSDTAHIGDTYIAGVFSPALKPPPEPSHIDVLHAVLIDKGHVTQEELDAKRMAMSS